MGDLVTSLGALKAAYESVETASHDDVTFAPVGRLALIGSLRHLGQAIMLIDQALVEGTEPTTKENNQ